MGRHGDVTVDDRELAGDRPLDRHREEATLVRERFVLERHVRECGVSEDAGGRAVCHAREFAPGVVVRVVVSVLGGALEGRSERVFDADRRRAEQFDRVGRRFGGVAGILVACEIDSENADGGTHQHETECDVEDCTDGSVVADAVPPGAGISHGRLDIIGRGRLGIVRGRHDFGRGRLETRY
ncbi:hypothetical protein ACFQMM_20850 [Saliphagus sp. GCM10025308]